MHRDGLDTVRGEPLDEPVRSVLDGESAGGGVVAREVLLATQRISLRPREQPTSGDGCVPARWRGRRQPPRAFWSRTQDFGLIRQTKST